MAQVSIPACGACPVRDAGVCGAGGAAGRRGLSLIGASVRLSPRQRLFEQDERAEHVFVVATGALTLHRTRPNGERTICLGVRIESVSRALGVLRRAGAVAVAHRAIHLRDRAVLARISRNGGVRAAARGAVCGSREAVVG